MVLAYLRALTSISSPSGHLDFHVLGGRHPFSAAKRLSAWVVVSDWSGSVGGWVCAHTAALAPPKKKPCQSC